MKHWILILSTLVCSSANATFYPLYSDRHTPAPHYYDIVMNLKAGDEIEFGNGRRFKLSAEPVRTGMVDVICQVEEGFTLRIPRYFGQETTVDASYRAYQFLAKYGVQVIEPIDSAYEPRQYLGVRTSHFKYHYSDLFIKGKISGPERAALLDDLIPFVKSSWRFRNIGDQGEDQIVWEEGRGWLFLDALDEYSWVQSANAGHLFKSDVIDQGRGTGAILYGDGMVTSAGEKLRYPPDAGWADRLSKAIEEERLKNGLKYGNCRRFLNQISAWVKALR